MFLLQFPTPYQLIVPTPPPPPNETEAMISKDHSNGNRQLPLTDSGFMISSTVMSKIVNIIQHSIDPYATLIIQSNCEDVAIYLHDLAMEHGLHCIPVTSPVTSSVTKTISNHSNPRIPLRTQRWLDMTASGDSHSHNKRAVGIEWSTIPFLPNDCATETEVACNIIHQTPIHRCMLSKHSYDINKQTNDQ
jgi:hypothetical protein